MKAKQTAQGPSAKVQRRPAARAPALLPRPRPSGSPPQIDPKWRRHYEKLLVIRDRMLAERAQRRQDALQALEPFSMSMADSATDQTDHDLSLAELSAEQEALYEIDEAINRILSGSYGLCQETGKPIAPSRLRAMPWTRFTADVEARLEAAGKIHSPHLGTLRSVRRERQRTLADAEPEEVPEPQDEELSPVKLPPDQPASKSPRPDAD